MSRPKGKSVIYMIVNFDLSSATLELTHFSTLPSKNFTKMCQTDTTTSQDKKDMVAVGETRPINGVNGTSASHVQPTQQQQRNPYAPRYADFLSNISNFKIIESTLRGMPHTSSPTHMISG